MISERSAGRGVSAWLLAIDSTTHFAFCGFCHKQNGFGFGSQSTLRHFCHQKCSCSKNPAEQYIYYIYIPIIFFMYKTCNSLLDMYSNDRHIYCNIVYSYQNILSTDKYNLGGFSLFLRYTDSCNKCFNYAGHLTDKRIMSL